MQRDGACRRTQFSCQHGQQRRLAGAVGSQHPRHLPGRQLKIDIRKDLPPAPVDGKAVGFQHMDLHTRTLGMPPVACTVILTPSGEAI